MCTPRGERLCFPYATQRRLHCPDAPRFVLSRIVTARHWAGLWEPRLRALRCYRTAKQHPHLNCRDTQSMLEYGPGKE